MDHFAVERDTPPSDAAVGQHRDRWDPTSGEVSGGSAALATPRITALSSVDGRWSLLRREGHSLRAHRSSRSLAGDVELALVDDLEVDRHDLAATSGGADDGHDGFHAAPDPGSRAAVSAFPSTDADLAHGNSRRVRAGGSMLNRPKVYDSTTVLPTDEKLRGLAGVPLGSKARASPRTCRQIP